MMQELIHSTASEIAAAIRDRRISSTEALEAHLDRIARMNPSLNAIITLDEEGARKRAKEADDALARGEVWGPLHGVPITLKDGHSTAGVRTTSGYPPLADYVPTEDGTVAARLKAAGTVLMGKTNVSELLMDIQSNNLIFGRTNNPYNHERTSGGSSGGAAAALATGMTPLDIGSDLAGSIRIPAHFCGIYGLKTTERRVSMYGHIPDVPGKLRSHRLMWSIGPMARSVDDLYLAYSIIAGADGHDMDVPPVPVRDMVRTELREMRLAWAPTFPGVPVAHSIRKAIEKFTGELAGLAASVEEALPPVDFGELARCRSILSRSARVAFGPTEDEPIVPMADYFMALDTRDRITHAWESFFGEWDALICPVCMVTAYPHCPTDTPLTVDGEEVNYWRAVGHCGPFNFTGHPSVAIPIGFDEEGLPIGVQIVGKRWEEERLLGIAAQLAEVAGDVKREASGVGDQGSGVGPSDN